jgi:predicted NBD/HSP70 family sugar kinase
MAPARPGAGTTQEAVRRHNLGTLLAHLHHDGQLSRAALTERMGLNRSTIGGLVGELVDLGAVQQTAPAGGRTGAGRPSLDVRPSSEDVYVLAAEVGVDALRAARVGLGGKLLATASGRTPPGRVPEQVAGALIGLLRDVTAGAPSGAALLGIGVGVPGVVRQDDGVIRFAPNLGWRDVPLAGLLRCGVRGALPIHVANDADLGALAEHMRGAVTGQADVVFLAGDVGVGGGVIAGGRPLQGVGGYAGELGHLIVNPRGRTCRCGSTGCWETEVGGPAISRALHLPAGDLDALAARLAATRTPSAALRRVGRYLGLGLGSIVNILNPEVVVLGGVLRLLYPVVREATDEALATAALVAPREQVRVVVPALGGDAVLVGAAERCFHAVLADPARELAAACRDAAGALDPQMSGAVGPSRSAPQARTATEPKAGAGRQAAPHAQPRASVPA